DREAHGKHEPRHNAQRSEQDRARTEKHVAALSDRLAAEEVRLEVARYHVPKSRRGGVEDPDHQDDPPPEQRRPGSVPRTNPSFLEGEDILAPRQNALDHSVSLARLACERVQPEPFHERLLEILLHDGKRPLTITPVVDED